MTFPLPGKVPMKRRAVALFLCLFLLISLVANVFLSDKASASLATDYSDTMTRQKISQTSQHTIVFTMAASTSLAAGETIIYRFEDNGGTSFTFPSDGTWVTGDFSFDDGSARTITDVGSSPTCNAGNDNVAVTTNQLARTLTVTACPTYTQSGSNETVTFTVLVGTGSITNPSAAGAYRLTVLGSYGDDPFDIGVPILDNDQVSVTASVSASLTFDLDVDNRADANTTAHNESATPYTIGLGSLSSSAVTSGETTGVSEIYFNITTNAGGGAVVQVRNANGSNGLTSATSGDNIPSTAGSNTLTAASLNGGYGLKGKEQASATEGGLTAVAPFDGYTSNSSADAGGLTTSFQTIFNTGGAPIVAGDGKVSVRAIAGTSTAAAQDFTDTLTFIATGTY